MGLYLGKDKISALRTIEKTTQSMKAYLEAGGKCGSNKVVSFEGCWLVSDWENVKDCSRMFYYCGNLESIPTISTGNVTNMENMFASCNNLTSVPAMDTSKVTNMHSMFENCYKLTSAPAMDTINVTDMGRMFYSCYALTSIPEFDASNVKTIYDIFKNCYKLESIHMHGMNVSFDISSSTKFTREALVEILNNLATVTTSQTLTMGSTNLAKLTDADKAIATGKGWTLK